MKRTAWLSLLLLAACGADGPPIAPRAEEAESATPPAPIETQADRPAIDGDLGRPFDAATTTEEV